ncbi:MAG TPA: MFS transporter [Acidimicrobiia bacterium]|nr:MFS transporter [Acidimicrobiia bacterium]
MFAPIRALVSLRRGAPVALIVGAASVSFLFAATPFLIPEVAHRFDVSLGTAGLISSVQVLGFAAMVFLAGRRLSPSRSGLVAAALLGVAADAASALVSAFPALLALRFVAGSGAGLLTWLAWADAMRSSRSMRDIAAVGPLTVLIGAPLLAWVASVGGDRAVYLLLAVSMVFPASVPVAFASVPPGGRRTMSPSRSNVVLLAGLGILTMAGSALFIFLGAFGEREVGLTAVALSLGFSVNAFAGLIGARLRWRPVHAWPWMLLVAASASSIVAFPGAISYYGGMFGWGFAFWMAVPTVLGRVAEWSLVPEERVGDAQSIMAVGRAAGPSVASVLVGTGEFGGLAVFTGVGLVTAAGVVGGVEGYRRGRPNPVVALDAPA